MTSKKPVGVLKNATHSYPAGNTAVDNVNMTLYPSEIVGLVGANGSGKTTLLKLISGYMQATDGSVTLGGVPIEEYDEKGLTSMVNFVEQNPESQLVGPTVEDELARTCRMMGMRGAQIKDKVKSVLKELKMVDAGEWFLDEISNGERRRVALGLSLLSNPKILLLDEPLSDLDEKGIQATMDFLINYKNKGVSILISSHKLDELIRITDRVSVLSEGAMLVMDDTETVLRSPGLLERASVTLPAIPALCLELESRGVLMFDRCPLDLGEAKASIQRSVKVARL